MNKLKIWIHSNLSGLILMIHPLRQEILMSLIIPNNKPDLFNLKTKTILMSLIILNNKLDLFNLKTKTKDVPTLSSVLETI